MEITWRVGILESGKKTSKQKFWHRRQIWLDYNWRPENSILVLTCLESDQEFNTIVIDDSFLFPTVICTSWYEKRFRSYSIFERQPGCCVFALTELNNLRNLLLTQNPAPSLKTLNRKIISNFLYFPTVIYTPSYDQRFGSYDFWNSTRSLKFCSEQIQAFWEFCNHDSNSKVILGNFHFQHHSWLSHLSGGYPCVSIWLMVQKLRSFKVIGATRNSYGTEGRKLINFRLWS
jgi:hypothetical protein